MATYQFSALTHLQHLVFDPASDVLNFSNASISATEVRVARSTSGVSLSYSGKTVWLDGISLEDLPVDSLTFADGSGLLFGDGSVNPRLDWYGAEYDLESFTEAAHVWGLGGADVVQTGSGADWLVGNVALTTLNHVSRAGTIGSPNSSTYASVSADGNLVAFAGGWTSFGSTNDNGTDVFVKDMGASTVSNEHRNASGENGGSGSGSPVISADGKVLAFLSASDLTTSAASSGALYDIFLADVDGSGIEMVSTGTGGTLAADGRSLNPDLSFDGSSIVFESTTSNWAAGGSTATTDVFLKDRVDGTLTRISTSTGGADGNGDSINAKVSANGRYVVFDSDASNLTAGDTNDYRDVFLWDRDAAGGPTLINLTEAPTARNPNNTSSRADIAADDGYGGVVVFQTAKAFVDEDTSNNEDIYAYHIADGSFTLVSSTAAGAGVQLSSEDASISGDGRFVVFTSYSDALVPGDTNGTRDIFVKDLYTGAIALVSKTADGTAGNAASARPQISLGGEWIVFESSASNLAGSDANGGFTDVFRVSNPLLKDILIGGAGNDTYELARADIIQEAAGAGTDTVRSSISYTLGANLENLTLTGTGNLSGTGNSLNNVITGNVGSNKLNGSTGTDTVSYSAAGAGVTVSLALTTAQATGAGSDTLSNFENLTGSAFNDRLTGNTGNNRLDGGLGSDTLIGGLGNDTYVVNANTDVVTEAASAGTDTVISGVTWTLGSTLENLTLSGTAAINGTGNSAANVLTGNAANNILSGGAGNDTLTGGAGNDRLDGGTGNDRLDGGLGSDTLIGGTGDDIYVVNANTDIVTEAASAGADAVISGVTWTLGSTLENLTLSGTTAINGTGNSAANVLTGNAANNILSGGAGNDSLTGGSGNDRLDGGIGNDRLDGGLGSDTLIGGVGDDTYVVNANTDIVTEAASAGTDTVISGVTWTLGSTLENLALSGTTAINGTGNSAANVLTGNAAANTLNGSSGNDTLTGGAGADRLTGGTGADDFVLTSRSGSDTVTDFASTSDDLLIRMSGVRVGDGDSVVDGALTRSAAGGFSKAAELVIFSSNVASLTTTNAAAAIGSATSAYATGATALFAVDNGSSSALYLFTSSSANASVSASELTLLATLSGTAATAIGDYAFGA